jgi:hypothetical protein
MPDVVALLSDPEAWERLRRAHRSLHASGAVGSMHEATSWQAVEDFLGGNPTAVVVVDPDVAGNGHPPHGDVGCR